MKEKLLLHSCCAPCSTSVIQKLNDSYDITVFYYNPNIYPRQEYNKRLSEQKRYISENLPHIKVIDIGWENDKYDDVTVGYEHLNEGEKRCEICFLLRLKMTAKYAKENSFDIFATTLTVSPHKNAKVINEIGLSLQQQFDIKYLQSDFKKQDGYLNSIRMAKQYNIYRQDYCGCKYSKTKNKQN